VSWADRRAHRFDEARGIKFETFAERRVRGAMIDALRKDAWPRGVRRQRRELRRRSRGAPPRTSVMSLDGRPGGACGIGRETAQAARIVRIKHNRSRPRRSASADHVDESNLPTVLVPSEPDAPDAAYEKSENPRAGPCGDRGAASTRAEGHQPLLLPEATMKEIGAEIGVQRSRVSQLHARAIKAACASRLDR
jgi:RNA polymerase sigma factor for flagellar operon FliA